jgi:DNA-binding transcriptional ArsR family regulator
MTDVPLTPEVLELVAERFKALAEPARLNILNALRRKEMTVSELMEATGLGQANASKHLRLLHSLGFVERQKEGLYVHYRLADQDVFQLCDIMCGRLVREHDTRRRLFAGLSPLPARD